MAINKGLIVKKLDEARKLLTSDELAIPITAINNPKYAPLEAIVLYLRDHMKMRNVEVAKLLHRSVKSTTQAYVNAKKKT